MISQDRDSTLDAPVLGLVSTAFDDVHLDRSAEDVVSRGRSLRRRRQAMPVLATAGILAASLSLAAVTQSVHSSGRNLTYNGAVVNVDEAGFSVHTDAKTGTVTVSIHPSQLFNANLLKQALAEAGIPAVFHTDSKEGTECTWRGAKQLDGSKVFSQPRPTGNGYVGRDGSAVVINRYAMPPGSVLAFEYGTSLTEESITEKGGTHTVTSTGQDVSEALLSNMPNGCTEQ